MTDPELLAKKLAEIETHVRELREEADLSRLRSDIKEERFVARDSIEEGKGISRAPRTTRR